jgi:hypothetical protein
VLLANLEVVPQLGGLEGHHRTAGLDYLGRKAFTDVWRAYNTVRAARPEAG